MYFMNQSELRDLLLNSLETSTDESEDEVCCSNMASSDKDYIEDNIILLNSNNLADIEINEDMFRHGVDDMSFLCGQITALVNVGIQPSMALSFICDKYTGDKAAEYNLKISEMNSKANIECSKYGAGVVSKMSM